MDQYVFGGIAGMCGVITTHPLDTIKTNIQNGTPVKIPKLYRGLIPPLLGVGIEKAIVFGTYNLALRQFSEKDRQSNLAIGISGGISGLGASIIVTPVERIKIRLQTNGDLNPQMFKPNELFRGLSATFTREVPGFAIYFLTFENLKKHYYPDTNMTKKGSFFSGGLSGALSWLFIYPQDLIKTQIQASPNNKNISFISVAKTIYKERGLYGFYRGFSLALIRAVPLHACTFTIMEMLTQRFGDKS